jgi:hypothetical protein
VAPLMDPVDLQIWTDWPEIRFSLHAKLVWREASRLFRALATSTAVSQQAIDEVSMQATLAKAAGTSADSLARLADVSLCLEHAAVKARTEITTRPRAWITRSLWQRVAGRSERWEEPLVGGVLDCRARSRNRDYPRPHTSGTSRAIVLGLFGVSVGFAR